MDHIRINNIYLESTWNNKKIIISMLALLSAYYARDVIFTKSLAKVTSDIPEFVKDVNVQKILILLFPYIVSMVLFYVSNILYSEAMPSIQLESVSNLVDKIMHSIKTSKHEVNVNDLLIHIKTFAESGKFYKVLVSNIFPTIIVIMGVVYNMLIADTKYGLIISIILIMLILITTKLEYDNVFATHEAEKSMNGMYDEIHEILSNIDTIITSNTEAKEKEGIEKIKENAYRLSAFAKGATADTTSQMQSGSLMIVIIINYLSYRLYVQKYIDTPILIANVMMSILFMDHYNKMLDGIKNVMTDTGAFYELTKYFKSFGLSTETEDNRDDLRIVSGDISLKNVNLNRKDNPVFTDLNMKIRGGSKTGIVGSIGSGKTSLMKLLSGVIHYDGYVYIDKQDLKKCKHESVTKHIIYIPQHPVLFNKTLFHNITYGTDHTRESAISVLKDLDLMQFFNAFPKGLDTMAGKGGGNLSGGQKQMICLIRSLLQNKHILLLDEPTSSLDKKNRQIFVNLIKKLKNKTIIINTHDENLFDIFDDIINIEHIKKKKPNIVIDETHR
jgi:ATP-binding cassette subfamily C protein LapB